MRIVHVAKNDPDATPIKPAAPPSLGLGATPRLVAYTTASKYCHHRPHYRSEDILLRRHGVSIPRNTLGHWNKVVADTLEPLYKLIHLSLLSTRNLQADETPVKYLDPGKEGIDLSSCWAHARREFHEAHKIGQRLAAGPIAIIAKLYQIEATLRETQATARQRTAVRQQQSAPVLEILKSELLALRQRPEVLPKGKLARAIYYTLALWDRLILFVRHGEIEIDNNLIENGIRPTAIGKKNWLFIGGETTGQRPAIIYTLVECVKRHGHAPEVYLADILTRLPGLTNQNDLSVLLPSNWQPAAAITTVTAPCPV